MTKNYSDDDEWDARVRGWLRDLPVPAEFAVPLPPRRHFLRAGLAWAAGIAGVSVAGSWALWREFSTPSLVRTAFAHARDEEEVRGMHVRDLPAARAAFGITENSLPGTLQLCKDCMLGNQSAWHVNVYLDDQGFVHLFALHNAPSLTATEGQALEGYWRFFTSRSGFTVLALAQNPQALSVITRTLSA